MSNRVLLGQRGGGYGLWVSAPGNDVMVAEGPALLFDSSEPMVQMIASGIIGSIPAGGIVDIPVPNMGFNPFTFVMCSQGGAVIQFPNFTTVRLSRAGFPGTATSIRYAIFNQPMD